MTYNYNLPPQNLSNLDPEHHVEFVRARGTTHEKEQNRFLITDSDDIPEIFPSTSTGTGISSILEEFREKSVIKKEIKIEEEDDDDIIILNDDVEVKKEPKTTVTHVDLRDVNGFLKAAKDGNLEEIRRLLKKKVPIDVTDFYGWTATICAAAEGNFDICKYLLENGANPGVRDKNGLGILQVAQKNRQKDFVKKLFDYFCKRDQPTTSSEPEELSFCELCDIFIPEQAINHHISSITHQLNDQKSTGAAPQTGIQLGPSNIGYRLMCASGWTEEQGLGRNSDGHRFPIKTILKRNRTGLGMENLPKKVTHFGPYDKNSVRVERKVKPVTKKDLEHKKKKEDQIAKKFRSDFSDNDSVYDYFHGK